jgi:hypothetical protein
VVKAVLGLLRTPPLPGCVLVIDQTGVVRPVVDLLADGLRDRVTCTCFPITITAGDDLVSNGVAALGCAAGLELGRAIVHGQGGARAAAFRVWHVRRWPLGSASPPITGGILRR